MQVWRFIFHFSKKVLPKKYSHVNSILVDYPPEQPTDWPQ